MTTIAYKDGVIETQSKQVLGHLPAILCDHWIGPPHAARTSLLY
ncbi:hypothetical protein PSFL6913_19790 [Pseudomonas fluorescens]|uniref:Uncharacterized protein n=2 Tax=Pseudomonas fluorescens TaxID=294 RepID=A0ABY1TMC0_PSEFL|nr:hypothetical protein SAMN04488487_5742 [Pseudomonas fluorescens]SQF92192.1 Uncharacterised protein [Pseudomonas fluorescens]